MLLGAHKGEEIMPVEIRIAAYGALLLFVHIFIATRYKTAQYGRAWNVGARDEKPKEALDGKTVDWLERVTDAQYKTGSRGA